jgi:transcription initiation factor TFIIH subunit 2
MDEGFEKEYKWEQDYSRTWKMLKEDNMGDELYKNKEKQKYERKKYLDEFNSSIQSRSMIRYLSIIIDCSSSAKNNDFRPSRIALSVSYLKQFISDFFDQNPLSQISIIQTMNEKARLLSSFNESPKEHIAKLEALCEFEGEPSI